VAQPTSLGGGRSLSNAVKASGVGSVSRKRLKARSGQAGSVVRKGDVWHGRFYIDVAGQEIRRRRSVPIGSAVGDGKLTRSEARNKLQEYIQELGVNDRSHLLKTLRPVQTFDEVATWWEENKMPFHKPSSRSSSRYIVKAHLRPNFGKLPIDQVDEKAVQEWISGLHKKGKLAPKTIHNMWKVLRLVLGKKHVSGWAMTLPALVQKEQRYFTPEEMVKIIDAAEGQFKPLFALQYAAGMRFGEVAGLHVEDLDFDNSVVHIRRSVYLHEETTPKTAAGYRDVDIHPDVMAMLKKHVGDRQTGLVFIGRRGKPLVVGNVNGYVLKPILKKLELPYGTTHAMRHGAVSRFQEAGVHGDLITKWVGHTSLKMTSKYTHFSAKHRKEVVAKLGAIAS
jgi:integrase